MATEEKAPEAAAQSPKPSGGGFKAWLPLILTMVLMPVLAWATTTFLLLPKLKAGLGMQSVHGREAAGESEGGGHGGGHGSEGGASAGKPKNKHQLEKMIVNVSGSGGTRLLLVSITLAGNKSDFTKIVEESTDQLRDIASGILGSKTITDLERPDARNIIRSELLSQFNAALGEGTISEIYITELAIQ